MSKLYSTTATMKKFETKIALAITPKTRTILGAIGMVVDQGGT
jgi:hypothetical protein